MEVAIVGLGPMKVVGTDNTLLSDGKESLSPHKPILLH